MNAVIYCRVSTKEQAEEGESLPVQEKICRDYAQRNGYDVLKVFIEEGESAKTINRTKLKELLDFISKNYKNIQAVIVYKIDRLTRDIVDLSNLTVLFSRLNIVLRSVTENIDETPVGKFTRTLFGGLAQLDNEMKGQRVKDVMKKITEDGRWVWRAPIGYTFTDNSEKRRVLTPTEEKKYIIEAFRMLESGAYSQVDIVHKLKKDGLKRISRQTLNKVLRNSLYAGLIKSKWNDNFIEAIHPSIISKSIFFKVQDILDGRRPNVRKKNKNNPDFPLRNFVRCSYCHQKLTAGWSKGKTKRYPYYFCRTKGCDFKIIRKEKIENEFIDYLTQLQPKDEILELFHKNVLHAWKETRDCRISEERKIQEQLANLEKRKARIEELMIAGTFDDETYKEKIIGVKNEILIKQIELSEVTADMNDIECCLNYCKYFLRNVSQLWANGDFYIKKQLQKFIFPEELEYSEGAYLNSHISLIFKYLEQKSPSESYLATPAGFEPAPWP